MSHYPVGTIRLGISITPELNDRLREAAKKNHRSKAAETIVALEKHLYPQSTYPVWTSITTSGTSGSESS